MENFIKIETQHEIHSLEMKFDNTTEFKDCQIIQKTKKGEERILNLQISQHNLKDFKGEVMLEIGNITLIGREVKMLQEFINQLEPK